MSNASQSLSSIPEEHESPDVNPARTPTKSVQKTPQKAVTKTPTKTPVKTTTKTPCKMKTPTPLTPVTSRRAEQPTTESNMPVQPYTQADPLSTKLLALYQMEAKMARIAHGKVQVRKKIEDIDSAMDQCRREMDGLVLKCYGGGGGNSSPEKKKAA
ncbi:hypothetical protein SLS57_000030 [Botryosphaeria dothidea]